MFYKTKIAVLNFFIWVAFGWLDSFDRLRNQTNQKQALQGSGVKAPPFDAADAAYELASPALPILATV